MAKPSKTPVVFAPWEDETQKPIIQFKNVTKRFGNFTAIDNLSLDIFEREFFALLGPSGCGKTTIMRMLAGFEAVTEGTILLGGKDISPVPPNKRPVNMMFQSYALFPHLSVWDNIAFGLRRSSMPKDEIGARVDEMLRLTRMEKFAKRKPHQISGGQRQRVALARSLAKAPKLLLLDEPLGALDKKLRHDTQFELMDIQEKTGTTFVIVTHDQEEAMTVASRVAVMDHGKLTDHNGKSVNFRNVILIMTSNAGAAEQAKEAIGFGRDRREGEDTAAIERIFTPEFRNRLDAVIPFAPLPKEVIVQVVEKFVLQLEAQLMDRNVQIDLTPAAAEWLADKGYDDKMGARPLARVIQESIKKPLAEELLFGKLMKGGVVKVKVKDGKIELEVLAPEQAKITHSAKKPPLLTAE